MENKFTNTTFYPWVGDNYSNGGIFNKKILALGESHYNDGLTKEQCLAVKANDKEYEDTTSYVISDYLNNNSHPSWENTFRKFERLLTQNAYTTREDTKAIWDSIVFYNYIQHPLFGPRITTNADDFDERSEKAFDEIIKEYQPDIIIFWGKRLWWNMTDKQCVVGEAWDKSSKGHDFVYCEYSLDNNSKNIKAFSSNHPSSPMSYDKWFDIYKSFLK